MQAKDTVMSLDEAQAEIALWVKRLLIQNMTEAECMANIGEKLMEEKEAQAEISFKAGEKQGIRQAIDNLKMHHCIVDVEARIKEIENDQL